MKYPSDPTMLSILVLTPYLYIGVVLTAPVVELPSLYNSITEEVLKSTCDSPLKNSLHTQNSSAAEFCKIPNDCDKELSDSRSILCCGFLDLQTSLCSLNGSPGNNFPNQPLEKSTENVKEFCTELKIQVQKTELSNFKSFKYLTKFCEITCESLSLNTTKLNIICPLLLEGSQMLAGGAPELEPKGEISSAKPQVVEKIPSGNEKMGQMGGKIPLEAEVPSSAEVGIIDPKGSAMDTTKVVENENEAREPVGKTSPITDDKSINTEKEMPKIIPNDEKPSETDATFDENMEARPISQNELDNVPPPETLDSIKQNPVIGSETGIEAKDKDEAGKASVPPGDATNVKVPKSKDEGQNIDNKLPSNSNQSSNSGTSNHESILGDPGSDEEEGYNRELPVQDDALEAKMNGQFVNSDDPQFFQYFMIISAAFILGYVALVNKKKLIALVVEGRRDGSRRRHHNANYSKLHSNLEEALSSNHTAVSTHHVLY